MQVGSGEVVKTGTSMFDLYPDLTVTRQLFLHGVVELADYA
jgi:hypothetical protein